MTSSKKTIFYRILKEIFYVLLASLLIFSLFETLWPRIVISKINLNWLLLLWLLIGIFILITKPQGEKDE